MDLIQWFWSDTESKLLQVIVLYNYLISFEILEHLLHDVI